MKDRRAEQEEDRQVGNQEGEPRPEQREEEVPARHRGGDEALQQFRDPKIHDQKADPPEPAPHRVQSDQTGDQEIDVPRAGLNARVVVGGDQIDAATVFLKDVIHRRSHHRGIGPAGVVAIHDPAGRLLDHQRGLPRLQSADGFGSW